MLPAKRKDGCQIMLQIRFDSVAFVACRRLWEVSPVLFEIESTAKNVVARDRRSLPTINAKLSPVSLPHRNFSNYFGWKGQETPRQIINAITVAESGRTMPSI